ncbi:S8 family serine peptidase [Streptomyces sp. SID13031]|uniref:S8 family peptidase n=1 Tax=Streptomyces sp. SID13031 TaxID=2706046 RepID=UPI0013CAAEE7|nr:S8 family serine peptidase [Streptomyces sp. SID13031]NEA31252.1 S8 family serine peptidase [Streptomyces sp. SID13031]
MHLIRPVALLASLALLLTAPPGAGAEPVRESRKQPTRPPGTAMVTLITGDRVEVESTPGQPERVSFRGGGAATAAVISRTAEHTYVIPTEVLSEVAKGRLDRALFDVKGLIQQGYDDAHRKTLPVIVQYAGSPATARTQAKKDTFSGTTKSRLLTSIGARATQVIKGSAFWGSISDPVPRTKSHRVEPQIRTIRLDRRIKAALDQSVTQIGAPASWQRGYTGKGIKVAVLDTGIDKTHPDLEGRVGAQANFSDSPDTLDRVGHGTHVAGTIAGTGTASQGKYRGVAPDTTLLNGKVLDDDGYGTDSSIITGMEWATTQGAKVVNLSLGGEPTDGTDPVAQAVNTLSRQTGALFVVAAGNCFDKTPGQIASPASAEAALAVGNLTRDGGINETSCPGPRRRDGSLKPEISAPGTGIIAARAAGTAMGEPIDDLYTAASGTSMATPHVAGTAALLAQRNPDWTGEQLRNHLIATTDPQSGSKVLDQGAGRVDADQATESTLTLDTPELDYGYLPWPHPNPAPVTKKVTYRNSGTTPVSLRLDSRADEGSAPVRVSATDLLVPAGGQASVEVTAEFGGANGSHSGRIVASPPDGGDPLISTYGWYLEPEMYDVTVSATGLDGNLADSYVLIGRRGDGFSDFQELPNGRRTFRLPAGSYAMSTTFLQAATDTTPDIATLAAESNITVAGDRTVALDARKAKLVRIEVKGKPDLRPHNVDMVLTLKDAKGYYLGRDAFTAVGQSWELRATPTTMPTTDRSTFAVGAPLEAPPYWVRIAGTGRELPVSDFLYAPRFSGTKTLVPVDAGTAAPDDLTGDRVKGKLALVRQSVGAEAHQALAAEQAGATAVMFFDPDRPGLARAIFPLSSGVTIPVLATDRVTAGQVLEQAKALRITGVAFGSSVYQTAEIWPGRIPADPSVRKAPTDFAAVQEEFGAPTGDGIISSKRAGYGTEYLEGAVGESWDRLLPAPGRHTTYLTGSLTWVHKIVATDRNFASATRWFGEPRLYKAGEQLKERWFAPVAISGLPRHLPEEIHGTSFVGWERDMLIVAIPPFAHGASRTEEWPYSVGGLVGTYDLVVRRNGSEIGRHDQPAWGFFDVPTEAAYYQISLDAQRQETWWQYSTRVTSNWSFRSRGGKPEFMPLIVADIDVPGADLRSQVKVGRPTRIDLGLRHQTRSQGSRFTKAKLEMSQDGKNWVELPLRAGSGNSYSATVTHPAEHAGRPVHLRLEVADADGGRLTQEVTRAYGLTK